MKFLFLRSAVIIVVIMVWSAIAAAAGGTEPEERVLAESAGGVPAAGRRGDGAHPGNPRVENLNERCRTDWFGPGQNRFCNTSE